MPKRELYVSVDVEADGLISGPGETLLGTKILLLAALIADADLSEAELEAFLAKARAEADAHIG